MALSALSGPRFAWERIRRGKVLALVLLLGLATTDGLASAVLLLQSVTARQGVEAVAHNLGQERYVRLSSTANSRPDYDSWQSTARAAVARELPGVFDIAAASATTIDLILQTHDGLRFEDNALRPRPFLVGYDRLGTEVSVVSGELPRRGALEVAANETIAAGYGLRPGTALCLSSPTYSESVCLRVSGIVRAGEPNHPFWGGRPVLPGTLLTSVESVYAAKEHLEHVDVEAGTLLNPRPDALARLGPAELARRLDRLRGRLLQLAPDATLQTSLDDAVSAFLARQAAARYATRIVGVQLLGLALLYLTFAADHCGRQRRRGLAVLRARGWTRSRAWRLLATESAMLAAAALPLGVALAVVAVRLVTLMTFPTAVAPLDWTDVAAAWPALAAASAAGVTILGWRAWAAAGVDVLPARRLLDSPPTWSGWWQALTLGLLAIPVALTARSLAAGPPALGDAALVIPLAAVLMAAPALSRLALLPVGWLSTRSGDLARAMAAWQLRRVSGGHRRLALLMVGGFAVTVFASVYMSSEPRTVSNRAAYQVGSDLRVAMSGSRPPLRETVTALPGFESATYGFRATARVGNYTLRPQLLGVDPVTFSSAAWWRSDLDRSTLGALMTTLAHGETDGLRPAGRPRQLGLWVLNPGSPLHVTARVADADGRAALIDLGDARTGAWRYLEGEIHFDRPAAYPLRFRELLVSSSGAYRGTLALSDLGFRQDGVRDPDVVETFNEARGWWSTSPITFARADSLTISPGPRRDAARAAELSLALSPGQQVYIRPPAPSVPALLGRQTLERLGLHTGDVLNVIVDSSRLAVRLVGSVVSFPTLYPDSEDFLVASGDPLFAALGQAAYWQPWPNEAWVRVGAFAAAGDAQRLRELDSVTAVMNRRAIDAAAQSDPIWRSILAELLIGAYAASALAIIALGLHFTAAARGRHPEFAVLRADGLPLRRLRASLGWEQALVVAGSLLAGSTLGLVLSWLIVPAIQLHTELFRPVPAAELMVDPGVALASIAVLVGVAAATAVLAVRAGTRVDVVSELRML